MPIYEYRCTACENEFEYEHRMSEKKTECERCGGALERLISRTAFAFKGGGWYKDLYASPKPGSGTGGGDSGGSSGGSTGGSSGGSSGGSDGGGSSGGSSSSSTPSGGGSSAAAA